MAENTINRIKQYLDYRGIRVGAFEKVVGMSNGSFASQLKHNKTIGVDKLENILKKYTDIDIEWLLTGEGDMIKLNVLCEKGEVYKKTEKLNEHEINYKDLAEARKETIESLKKIIQHQDEQIAAFKQNNQ
ncbi:hypothetical protein DBB36_07505 [Flavobacterium sp. WLB]|uniref:hypothetical protein n=1 Tax=unclassified Flavobacterium TaxID=196869 RepID=UPI0006ABB813|nr:MULTISPECIES: hypothetical protein [unclassified Flavobacterium]OWU90263.1 hypothetical protein APR43_14400 [Flavobacterium sp. NLM]PUU70677.1 hypothetical protein DBB36_07505 [Flavobacterium sp. WLB]